MTDAINIRIPHDWTPRPYQIPLLRYLQGGGTRAVALWHRRAGKDSLALHWCTMAMVKRLGGKNWIRLHRGVYIAGVCAAIHFIMMRKGFQIEPLIYAGILAALLATRLGPILKKRQAQKLRT